MDAAAQPDAGDRRQHRLAARQLADASVEHVGREAGLGERGVGARLDVPVGADRVEVRGSTSPDSIARSAPSVAGHAEQLGDGSVARRASAAAEGRRHPSTS